MDMKQDAISAALNIVELLEAILFYTSMTDVFLAQRVCRSWKATISGSKKLQELLFLRAKETECKNYFALWICQSVDLLVSVLPLFYTASSANIYINDHANPLLIFCDHTGIHSCDGIGVPRIGAMAKNETYSDGQLLPLLHPVYKIPLSSWAYPTASWREMHLSSPSTTHVIVSLELDRTIDKQPKYSPYREAAVDWRILHDPDGVRAGHVFDMAFKLWTYHKGKLIASAHILPQPNGPWYNNAVEAISRTEIGQVTINRQSMELMRMDHWRCSDDIEWILEPLYDSDSIEDESSWRWRRRRSALRVLQSI